MSSSGATRGYGAAIAITAGDPAVTTALTGFSDFDMPDQTPGNIDVTHHGSPNDTEEFVPDMKTAPTWVLSHHYVPGSDPDVALSALNGTGETFLLSITLPGAPAVEYAAYLSNYRPTGIAPKGGVMMVESTFTVMGRVAA